MLTLGRDEEARNKHMRLYVLQAADYRLCSRVFHMPACVVFFFSVAWLVRTTPSLRATIARHVA